MRFIHTADVHLDVCFAALRMPARAANRRRQSLRDVFQGIVRRAIEWPADALLIAGDLFEHEHVTRDTAAFLREAFASMGSIPVFIAPGNHDPYMPSSPYASETWPGNVVIFSKPEWTTHTILNGAAQIHGFGFDGFEISANPFGTLRLPDDGRVHVAVGHGTERAHQPPDGKSYAPFDAAAAATPGLAYLALGHFHDVTEIKGDFATVMYYSGAPESHGFNHPGMRHYLEVEIADGPAQVTRVPSARAVYASYELDCSALATAQQAIDRIRAWGAAAATPQIARVTLTGTCLPSVAAELAAIQDAVASDFEYLAIRDESVLAEDYDELARETSSLGTFVRRLNEEIADAPDPERRRMIARAREVGLAAYREQKLPIFGLGLAGERL